VVLERLRLCGKGSPHKDYYESGEHNPLHNLNISLNN